MLLERHKNILFARNATAAALAAGTLAGLGISAVHGTPAARPPALVRHGSAPLLAAPFRFDPLAAAVKRARHQPRPRHATAAGPRATISLYERTAYPRTLRRQGCTAAKRGVGGVVILDFGQPAYNGHTYGTNLFSGRFAGNAEITRGLLAYARGYAYCVDPSSDLRISLARGTSNYHPAVPSAYKAGRKWARETMRLSQILRREGVDRFVTSAAADDVEPAWDRTFHRTRDFYRGYRDGGLGHLLYNYGSLDGGVGSIWNLRQAFYVAAGMKYARPIPEIYNHAMARQWAELAHIARHVYHRPVQFAGVMTTHTSANHGMKPADAHRSLVRALATVGASAADLPPTLTNIRSAY
jgi:hypothetical protein